MCFIEEHNKKKTTKHNETGQYPAFPIVYLFILNKPVTNYTINQLFFL